MTKANRKQNTVAGQGAPTGGEPHAPRSRRARWVAVLRKALVAHPGDRDTLLATISFARDAGDAGTALGYARQFALLTPGDQGLIALIENLKQQVDKPHAA